MFCFVVWCSSLAEEARMGQFSDDGFGCLLTLGTKNR